MAYDVCFTEAALKNLQCCSHKDKKLIIRNIEQLAADPLHKSNVKKLVDFDAAAFRMRIGNYRILFDREDGLKVIDFEEYLSIKALLSEPEKLEDYLEYLHMQAVKQASSKRFTLAEVKQACDLI